MTTATRTTTDPLPSTPPRAPRRPRGWDARGRRRPQARQRTVPRGTRGMPLAARPAEHDHGQEVPSRDRARHACLGHADHRGGAVPCTLGRPGALVHAGPQALGDRWCVAAGGVPALSWEAKACAGRAHLWGTTPTTRRDRHCPPPRGPERPTNGPLRLHQRRHEHRVHLPAHAVTLSGAVTARVVARSRWVRARWRARVGQDRDGASAAPWSILA